MSKTALETAKELLDSREKNGEQFENYLNDMDFLLIAVSVLCVIQLISHTILFFSDNNTKPYNTHSCNCTKK